MEVKDLLFTEKLNTVLKEFINIDKNYVSERLLLQYIKKHNYNFTSKVSKTSNNRYKLIYKDKNRFNFNKLKNCDIPKTNGIFTRLIQSLDYFEWQSLTEVYSKIEFSYPKNITLNYI